MLAAHVTSGRHQNQATDFISLVGAIDETAGPVLAKLQNLCNQQAIFNFAKIESINSLGVRHWINFIRHFQEGKKVFYEHCTQDFMMQINMIPVFQATGTVLNFYLTYTCDNCNHESSHLIDCTQEPELIQSQIETMRCEECRGNVEPDEDVPNLLAFVARQN